jgi:hypothetical protein
MNVPNAFKLEGNDVDLLFESSAAKVARPFRAELAAGD